MEAFLRRLMTISPILLFLPINLALAGWEETFEPEAIGSYLSGEDASYLVVAAGDRERSLAAASQLLVTLRSTTKGLVMEDQSLGDMSGLDDTAILERASELPVDQIVVVRVFDSGHEAPSAVVVVFYDKQGETLVALSGVENRAIASRGELDGVSRPVPKSRSNHILALESEGAILDGCRLTPPCPKKSIEPYSGTRE